MNKFKNIETLSHIISDQNGMELESHNRREIGKFTINGN